MSTYDEHFSHVHVPGPGESSIPELEIDETVPPRPEEEVADVARAEPDVADHSHHRNIVRVWRGVIRTEDRDEYVDYVERTGIEEYRALPGNKDAWTLTRELADGLTEILTVSRWDSVDSIRAFAGDDVDRAVYYPEDDRFLVERDDTVRHYVQRS